MAVSDSQWPHATGFVSNRLFQVMSAGALMLQQDFDGMYDLLGLVDGEHLVVWKSFAELADKIRYFLYNDEERNKIAKAGELFVRENHSFDVRVKELLYELKKRGTDYTSLCK
jgi:spore maturation protein CgeB